MCIIGIGPGNVAHLSARAEQALAEAQIVSGYRLYIDLIRPLLEGKRIIQSGMTQEVDRVEAAIDAAVHEAADVAIVSSGDPGIYAMAGLAFEICRNRNIRLLPPPSQRRPGGGNQAQPEGSPGQPCLQIEVVPGIPALASGASLLGAPLTHDFACVSLSDLLTPWQQIEARIEAAAKADFVLVIYNPKSRKRADHLVRAQQILLQHRSPQTIVGIVQNAMRENECVTITCLKDLHLAQVDMLTTVFIGNSRTFCYEGYMITPRGYAEKYGMRHSQ
ncbi:precorrin-3B C(17)-methyltransferase [Desulfatirhabdium butyrativorans]|uniref:precorrin-3B C(17)-methyltransferase n=1 Tax=Desulfatirhabdium butyrativorans TaxID=340467 RepID=UPI0006849113|nr:precorrin-3B C(17)-methyltransferase [Desulfatirhabdium butyrativorans]